MVDSSQDIKPNAQSRENEALVTLAHGSGGAAMAALINDVLKPIFNNSWLNEAEDQARIRLADLLKGLAPDERHRLAMTTDSYVINPIEFPGGDIGKLAACGTLNDLAVGGAIPRFLSVGFILEEGLSIDRLSLIARSIQQVAEQEGVAVVTGDTKVVPRGAADGVFVNTTGVGIIPADRSLACRNIQPGDALMVNGQVGNHGAAIADVRDGLGFTSDLQSDCASLNGLIQSLLSEVSTVRCIRDATRGGIAAVANEFAQSSGCDLQLWEAELPLHDSVKAICELLGFDPLHLANEGNALWVVKGSDKDAALSHMQSHPLGRNARIIGEVKAAKSRPRVTAKNALGTERIVDLPMGELLPRIC